MQDLARMKQQELEGDNKSKEAKGGPGRQEEHAASI